MEDKELITQNDQSLAKSNETDRLFMSALKDIKNNLPFSNNFDPKKISNAFTLGLTALLATYWVLPDFFHTYRDGYDDEIAAIAVFISTLLFSSMSTNIPALCRKIKNFISEENWNLMASTSGGLSLGVGVASLTPIAPTSLFDGGILLGLTTVGLIGGVIYNKLHKISYCDRCHTKGQCHQKICRHCKHLYHPAKNIKDTDSFALSGYEIASYFGHQGLSYFDAKILTQENIMNWKVYSNNGVPEIDKESFFTWVNKNKERILTYNGISDKLLTEEDIEQYLRTNNL